MYIRFELTVKVRVQAALTAQVQLERARRGGGHRTSFSVSKSRGVRITLISQGSRLSQMSKDA